MVGGDTPTENKNLTGYPIQHNSAKIRTSESGVNNNTDKTGR